MFELNDFNSIKISVASPEKIRELSKGEVTKGHCARIDYNVSRKVNDLFQRLGRHIEDKTYSRRPL